MILKCKEEEEKEEEEEEEEEEKEEEEEEEEWGTARIAQLVQRPTEKPGTILTRVRVRGAARDFSPRVNFQCRMCVRERERERERVTVS